MVIAYLPATNIITMEQKMSHVYAPLEQRQLLANTALVIAATGVAVQSTLLSHFPAYSAYMPHVKMAFEAALVGGLADFSPPL
mgnify:CR=1 FL=1